MKDMDALVDLIRALSRKCEEVENYKSSSEMYERWYREGREENKALRQKLEGAGIE